MVEQVSDDEHVATLEIPYTPIQILVSPNPRVPMVIPHLAAPLVIIVPSPFHFESTKVVPWKYNSAVYIHGEKQEEPNISSESTINIASIGGMTQSGRIFASVPSPEKDNIEVVAKNKGKQVVSTSQGQVPPQNKSVPEDVEEFLRIIKRSDYKVVDQLNQTPSKIFILSLLLCSEAHRDALIKFLSATHVPQEINVNQFEGIVANITASSHLGFCDNDLPPEGRSHNKALHISIECADTIMSRLLVDIGSSLNVLPKNSFTKLTIEGLLMKLSTLVVRAFDSSRRTVMGEVDLPIKVGPYTFFTTFFVMDIFLAYSCLLGHPWIHSAGEITSTLHQKLKFIVNGKMITIDGEEDVLVIQLSSFRYIEVGGEIHETLFQAFEITNVLMAPLHDKGSKKFELPMSSLKAVKIVIEDGHPKG
ncbi:uncharacterized protein LOC127101883 [Lathyrus oleraceus]|uniref:uncharacterized protein LOC127101883 n=1 Tax=Pisum sativum TaxID=3888 RepID=UPI0021D03356|nr:uncharacterized protein LOC127101883 [Pisum sativum]